MVSELSFAPLSRRARDAEMEREGLEPSAFLFFFIFLFSEISPFSPRRF